MASNVALMGVAGRDCYTAVKGGIAAITCSMAVEFADLRPRTLPAAARQVKAGFQTTSFVSLPHCGAAFTPRLISLTPGAANLIGVGPAVFSFRYHAGVRCTVSVA